jgi:DNA replication protein DnaC
MKTKWQTKWLALDVRGHCQLQELADQAEKFCGRWAKNNPAKSLLVIVGEVRTGKSHVAKKIFRFCHTAAFTAFESQCWGTRAIPSSLFLPWPEVVSALVEKNRSIMDDAFQTDLLILDDVGADNDPWKIGGDSLCQILSRRENKFTVITTNIQPAQWVERFDQRVADRLLRNSVVVDLSQVQPYRKA